MNLPCSVTTANIVKARFTDIRLKRKPHDGLLCPWEMKALTFFKIQPA